MTSRAISSPHLSDASKPYRRTEKRVEIGRDDKPPLQGTYDPAPPYRIAGAGPADEIASIVVSPQTDKGPREATPQDRGSALKIAAKPLAIRARKAITGL